MTSHLSPLSLQDLTEEDLTLLAKVTQIVQYGETLKEVLYSILNLRIELVRWTHGDGMLIAGLQRSPEELWIEFAVGRKMLKDSRVFFEDMKEEAWARECCNLGFRATSPYLIRLYESWGLRPSTATYKVEV